MITAYIGLGSNLEDPVAQIKRALLALEGLPNTAVLATSSFYQTTPVGYADQPDFINAVCQLETDLPARTLLTHLLAIEQAQGRVRDGKKNQPRTLDLDLLLYGNEVIQEPDLIVPHPRMHEREFVLVPLLEVLKNPFSRKLERGFRRFPLPHPSAAREGGRGDSVDSLSPTRAQRGKVGEG